MSRKALLTCLLLLGFGGANAQSQLALQQERSDTTIDNDFKSFREEYESFVKQARKEYENFRDQANREYVDFLRRAWKEFQVKPSIPKPKDEDVPPVVFSEEDAKAPVKDISVPIKEEEVIVPPAPKPQPVPVAPIKETPRPKEKFVTFQLYGTDFKVRFDEQLRFTLARCDENAVADAWKVLSGAAYNNIVRDCLEQRIRKQLSDWAYLQLLDKMATACLGKTNEATLLMAYVYCQSGYQMRLGFADGRLCMLYACEHAIFDHRHYLLDDQRFYPWGEDAGRMNICATAFPKEQPLSLLLPKEQLFSVDASPLRTLTSVRYPDVQVKVSVNKNDLLFFNDYPTSMVGNNIMTRWAMYANMPMPKHVQDELYPALKKTIGELSQKDAVERLLNWVQTAFVYEYDDKVWGDDRAFFPEETLYYPYCDCEDRAILLSRLVRDVLGMKAILVLYPGHLAMAVCFTEDVKGDYILLNGNKYVVCDPTYIGAPVGRTMPGMDNNAAKVILLE